MKTAHERKPCFVLRRSGIQGRGAFATRVIRKGTRIIEYVGERIDDDEADRRYDDDAMGRHHTFLFALGNGTTIDGAVGGNESAYINHSCEPNCEAIADDNRIFIHAMKTIKPGEELSYDYQYAREGTSERDARRLYPCHCGTASCRGTILAPLPKKKKPKKRASSSKPRRAA